MPRQAKHPSQKLSDPFSAESGAHHSTGRHPGTQHLRLRHCNYPHICHITGIEYRRNQKNMRNQNRSAGYHNNGRSRHCIVVVSPAGWKCTVGSTACRADSRCRHSLLRVYGGALYICLQVEEGDLNCITNTAPLPSFTFSAHILPFISVM